MWRFNENVKVGNVKMKTLALFTSGTRHPFSVTLEPASINPDRKGPGEKLKANVIRNQV